MYKKFGGDFVFGVIRFQRVLLIGLLALVLTAATAASYARISLSAANRPYEAAEFTQPAASVPIVMYHRLLRHGLRNDYTITPEQFEADLIYLSQNGFNTITVADLVDFVHNSVPLPDNPIMLTFDDGHFNNIYYGLPLLEAYGMRAVISIVGQFSDDSTETGDINPNYSYLTWEQVREVSMGGIFEIQNHSYNLHHTTKGRHGCTRNRGEDLDEFTQKLTSDLQSLQDKIFDVTGQYPKAFTFPFGAICDDSDRIVREMGFSASFSVNKGINTVRLGDPDSLFLLRRNIRPPSVSTEKFFENMLQ